MSVPQEISDRLLAECIGSPQAYKELGWLCDNVGGRTSGAESGCRGEEWAYGLFTKWGLQNVRYQSFEVQAWTRGTLDARVLEPAGWPLTALAHGYCPQQADVTAQVVDLGHAEREDWKRLKETVKGKIALCDEGASEGKRRLHRSEKLGFALEYGAAGLMILSSASGGLPRTGVCHHGESPIPSIGISQEDGERLRRLLKGGAASTVRIQMTNTITPGTARNVIAEIPGEHPEEVVLAGAHLDSWDVAQGATDNGLGSAIVLEMARSLASLGLKPRRTLRFAIWAAEEIGLCGSWEYARNLAESLPRHAAIMNFDMTGDPNGYWFPRPKAMGNEGIGLLQGLAEQLAGVGMSPVFLSKAQLHSDHQPFMLAGIPVVGLANTLHGEGGHYYHSVGDTFEKVSLPDFARAACVAAHTLWALGNTEQTPLPRLTVKQVREMIDEADLYEALRAEQYDGPPMHI